MQNLLPSGDNIRFNIVVNGQQETEWGNKNDENDFLSPSLFLLM